MLSKKAGYRFCPECGKPVPVDPENTTIENGQVSYVLCDPYDLVPFHMRNILHLYITFELSKDMHCSSKNMESWLRTSTLYTIYYTSI